MILLGLLCTVAALFPLYLKYRVVLTDERCKGKITGIAEQRGGYSWVAMPSRSVPIW